jgi:hypothetical protein
MGFGTPEPEVGGGFSFDGQSQQTPAPMADAWGGYTPEQQQAWGGEESWTQRVGSAGGLKSFNEQLSSFDQNTKMRAAWDRLTPEQQSVYPGGFASFAGSISAPVDAPMGSRTPGTDVWAGGGNVPAEFSGGTAPTSVPAAPGQPQQSGIQYITPDPSTAVGGINLTNPTYSENWYTGTGRDVAKGIAEGDTTSAGAAGAVADAAATGPEHAGQQDDIVDKVTEGGDNSLTEQVFDIDWGTNEMKDGAEAQALQRYLDQRPDLEGMMDAGLDPYFDKQRQRMEASASARAAAMGMSGSSAELMMLNQGDEALVAEQSKQEAAHTREMLDKIQKYEEAGVDAAALKGDAQRQWFEKIPDIAMQIDEFGLMSYRAASEIMRGMDQDGFQRLVESASTAQREVDLQIAGLQAGTVSAAAASKAALDRVHEFNQVVLESTKIATDLMMGLQNQLITETAAMIEAYGAGNTALGDEIKNQTENTRNQIWDTVASTKTTLADAKAGG